MMGYILKEEPRDFSIDWIYDVREREESRMTVML